MVQRQAGHARHHAGDRRRRQQLGDPAWRVGSDGDHRQPSRFGTEWRLARWRARHDGGLRGVADVQGSAPAGDNQGRGLGRRGRRALRPQPARLLRRRRQPGHSRGGSAERQGRHHPGRRAPGKRRRASTHARGAAIPQGDPRQGLPRAPHRAGSCPRSRQPISGCRDWHLRRGAPPAAVRRAGGSFRLDANSDAQGRLSRRGRKRARLPRDRPEAHQAARPRGLHGGHGESGTGHRDRGAGRVRNIARSARAGCAGPRADAGRGARRVVDHRRAKQRQRGMAEDLEHRAAAVRSRVDQAVRQRGAGSHRRCAAPAVGPVARRGRDGAAHARGDDVCLLVEWTVALQGRGHARGAPREGH